MAIFAIGDIQGCCDEFELLLAKIGVAPLKDPLKRGSASKDVVKGSVRDA